VALAGLALAPPFLANTKAGSFAVTASAVLAPPVAFQLTNTPGSPAALADSRGLPQSATVGLVYANALQAQVTDAYGNRLAVAGLKVIFTVPVSGASGTFGTSATATALTNASGVATAPAFTANHVAGSFTVTATAPGYTPASFSLTNTAGKPASIVAYKGTPQSAAAGTVYATFLVAQVKDAFGNPVAGVTVTFIAKVNGTTGATALFGGSATVSVTTDGNGLALAPPVTANTKTGPFIVTAFTSGVNAAAIFSLTNTTALAPFVRLRRRVEGLFSL
jgi:hypothetical protein